MAKIQLATENGQTVTEVTGTIKNASEFFDFQKQIDAWGQRFFCDKDSKEDQEARKKRIIELFMFNNFNGKYFLSFDFRKKTGGYKEYKPVIEEMLKEGTVKLVRTNYKVKEYQYTPKK